MGSGISRQTQVQEILSLINQTATTKPQQGLKKCVSEPALSTIRETTEQQTPVSPEGNQEISSLAKIIFPYMHSSPDLHQKTAPQTNPPNKSTLVMKGAPSKGTSIPPVSELSYRRGERNYLLTKTNSRKGSWKEMELAAIISKPFTGNLRTIPTKRNKLKNVRTIAVSSPPKP